MISLLIVFLFSHEKGLREYITRTGTGNLQQTVSFPVIVLHGKRELQNRKIKIKNTNRQKQNLERRKESFG